MEKGRIDRMTIVFERPGVRRRETPRVGDVKIDKLGRRFVRRQATMDVAGVVCDLYNHGRPVFEWVREDEVARG